MEGVAKQTVHVQRRATEKVQQLGQREAGRHAKSEARCQRESPRTGVMCASWMTTEGSIPDEERTRDVAECRVRSDRTQQSGNGTARNSRFAQFARAPSARWVSTYPIRQVGPSRSGVHSETTTRHGGCVNRGRSRRVRRRSDWRRYEGNQPMN